MGVLFGMDLRPIEDNEGVLWLYEHRVEHEWPERENFELDWVFYPPDAIREARNGPGWVPFYWDSGRNFLGIDLDPGPNGVVGQVIPFGYEDEFRPVLALSFGHLLEDVADELEAGHAKVAPPEVTHSPFGLKGAAHGCLANCYREWAEAKLPDRFKDVQPIVRFVPEDHATPITGELADQLVALLREFLTEMNEYERRWLAVRPIREYGVRFISEAGPNGGNNWSMDGPSPGQEPKNAVQAVLWDPDAKHDEKAEALGIGKHWKEAIAEKAKIWKRFLTNDERPTARAFTQSDPPYYNPRALIKPEVRQVTPEHVIIEFGQPKPPDTCGVGRLRYHLRMHDRRWWIERHEGIDDPKKPWKLDFA